ncbi:MAG: type II secretion system protein GspM [Parvularculaceae bacterium]
MKDRFFELSQREQVLIAIMAVLLAVVIAFLGIIRPLTDMRTDNLNRLKAEQNTLHLVQQVTGGQTKTAKSTPEQLGQTITRSARASGFQLATFGEEDSNRYLIKLNDIAAADVLVWLHNLERDNKIIVAESQFRKDARNGTVNATIYFIQG